MGSKDMDFNLVYFNRKNKQIPTWTFSLDLMMSSKNPLTYPSYVTTKTVQTQKFSEFLKLMTLCFFRFEQLSSSISQQVMTRQNMSQKANIST